MITNMYVATINENSKVFRTEKEALDFVEDAYYSYLEENTDIPEFNKEIMCDLYRNFLQKGITFKSYYGFVGSIHEEPLSPVKG